MPDHLIVTGQLSPQRTGYRRTGELLGDQLATLRATGPPCPPRTMIAVRDASQGTAISTARDPRKSGRPIRTVGVQHER